MKVGIVGTHGVGKTTLAYSLASQVKRLGFNAKVINEVVRRCPFPLNDGFTLQGGIWTICEQIRRELEAVTEGCALTICDRSALDPVFYLRYQGVDQREYDALERFAVDWLRSYDRLIWVIPSETMPLLADGVRSIIPDFQKMVHEYFRLFFETNTSFEYVTILSQDVFTNDLEQLIDQLELTSCMA